MSNFVCSIRYLWPQDILPALQMERPALMEWSLADESFYREITGYFNILSPQVIRKMNGEEKKKENRLIRKKMGISQKKNNLFQTNL